MPMVDGQAFNYDSDGRIAARQAEAEKMAGKSTADSSAKVSNVATGVASGAATGASIGMMGGPAAPITVPIAALIGGVVGGGTGYLASGAQADQAASNVASIAKSYQDRRNAPPAPTAVPGGPPKLKPLTMPNFGGGN